MFEELERNIGFTSEVDKCACAAFNTEVVFVSICSAVRSRRASTTYTKTEYSFFYMS